MTSYYSRKTPDYSPLLVHFTRDSKNRKMVRENDIPSDHPLHEHKQGTAIDRLVNILKTRTIHSSPMPLAGDASAVCFTECVWEGLVKQVTRYSPYGVVFSKKAVFEKGGGPALYLRGDILQQELDHLPASLKAFVVPFDPDGLIQPGIIQDWIHEREWRLPAAFAFDYADIKYVLVESIQDADAIIQQVGTMNIPADHYIPMAVYRTIRQEWGAP